MNIFCFFRFTDNVAIYRKVVEDDGKLESINDKRAACILIMNGLLTITDNIRSKILTMNDLDLLEEMLKFTRGIYFIVMRSVCDYCHVDISDSHKRPGSFYPLIRQARQMEIFSLLCDIHVMLDRVKKKRFFHECNKVFILNHFLRQVRPSLFFLQKFLLDHPHFHVIMPPPENKRRKKYPRYY